MGAVMKKTTMILFLSLAAACAEKDPLADVPRLSQVEDPDVSAALAANLVDVAPQSQPSLFGRLFSGNGGGAGVAATDTPAEKPTTEERAPTAAAIAADADAGAARPGLFSRLFGAGAARPVSSAPPEQVTPAAMSRPRPSGPDSNQVAPGTRLPFGEVATVCGLKREALGRKIETVGGISLHDSNPRATTPRAHYLTGFRDGCARQFTAALVMFGSPRSHETLRYNTRARYDDVDNAYEAIKSSVCRVGKGKPCGARMSRLERQVVMLTGYNRFGDSAGWVDILLHNKRLVAVANHAR